MPDGGDEERPGRRRSLGPGAVAGCLLVLAVGALAALALPALRRAQQTADRTRCANTLRQLLFAAAQYSDHTRTPARVASDVDGRGLMKLLVAQGYLEPDQLWCPCVEGGRYVLRLPPPGTSYVGAVGWEAAARAGQRNVVFADATVELVGEAEFAELEARACGP